MPSYGPVLRKRRAELGLRQRHVAQQLGVSVDYLSQLERDLRTPSLEMLAKLGEVLRVPVAYLELEAEPVNPDLDERTREAVVEAKRVAGELLRRIDELQKGAAAG